MKDETTYDELIQKYGLSLHTSYQGKANPFHSRQEMDSWFYKIHSAETNKEIKGYFYMGFGHKGARPNLKDILDSLVSDAYCYIQARDVDEFARDLGYTKPSEALAAWDGCRESKEKLETLFCTDDFNHIFENIERL